MVGRGQAPAVHASMGAVIGLRKNIDLNEIFAFISPARERVGVKGWARYTSHGGSPYMRLGYVQLGPKFGEVEGNLARAEALMESEADLWVLPELFSTGYQFASREEVTALAEPVPQGPTSRWLIKIARERGCHLVAGLPERAHGQSYNSALLVGPQGVSACYRKVHLFYQEKKWFSPGDEPFPVVDIGLAKVGLMICFDHLFPEAARALALAGAEVIAHPANLVLPGLGQLTMRVRALENRVFTVTANRIGIEARTGEALRFTGESQIVSPGGEVLVRSAPQVEEAQALEIDPGEARDKRLNEYNDLLADRRPELYSPSRPQVGH